MKIAVIILMVAIIACVQIGVICLCKAAGRADKRSEELNNNLGVNNGEIINIR